ncbi:MAG: ABC transporter ATP-binding protein [Bacteroidales bacterium]|nr:ABC transporter ATP-binding protein [Bacteroidales bacterium]MDD5978539.1 ABC transporter ATP-binding protein [Bacteroidales bacterium]MDD7276630.1 ABC transporter ATP-binding protein [Bacteroidales bacterium]
MIQANGIYKSFGNVDVIKGIDLHINKGEIVAIVGASGAGKSTLLQILGTLDKPDKGKVIIDNQDITSLNQKNLASFRNKKIGFVFQFHHLLPEFTALENICIPAFIAGVPKKEAADKAMALLEYLRLTERASHKPSMLSGGEQQRVAIARALINNPAIILADEPSGNLDSQNAKELHELFFSLREKTGQTFVIVTHNPSLANMADRALTIVDGKIEHNN